MKKFLIPIFGLLILFMGCSSTQPPMNPSVQDFAATKPIKIFSYKTLGGSTDKLHLLLQKTDGSIMKESTIDYPYLTWATSGDDNTAEYSSATDEVLIHTLNLDAYGQVSLPSLKACTAIFATDFTGKLPREILKDSGDCKKDAIEGWIVHPYLPLLFAMVRESEYVNGLYIIDIQNPERKKRIGAVNDFAGPYFSSDGKKLFGFGQRSGNIQKDILTVVDLETMKIEERDIVIPEEKRSKHFEGYNISPDGSVIAYHFGIFNLNSMNWQDVLELTDYDVKNVRSPWSLDSRYVLFQARAKSAFFQNREQDFIFDTTEKRLITLPQRVNHQVSENELARFGIFYNKQPVFKAEAPLQIDRFFAG